MRDRLIELIIKSDILCHTCGENSYSYCAEALAAYLLANGVIVPPCKVGDKVWYITNGKIDNAEVVCIDCRNSGNHIIAHKYIEETEEIKKLCVYFGDVNKIVYLTKEEAEQALKGGDTMDNIEKCECWIGVINDYDNTRIVTLSELKKHIKKRFELRDYNRKMLLTKEYNRHFKYWYLEEYCDKRYSTDLTRFEYCPICGKVIDWKAIKGGANG